MPLRGLMFGNYFGRKLHALGSRVIGLQGYFSRNATLSLLRAVKKINPDIVHLHNLHSNDINLPILFEYLIQARKKVIVTLHDCWFYTGKCTHYFSINCGKWTSGCGGCPKLLEDNPSWFFDRTSKTLKDKSDWYKKLHSLHVVAVSDWIRIEAERSILKKANTISRIYNWVDTELFKPMPRDIEFCHRFGIDECSFILLSVATEWSSKKGIESIIKIAEGLPVGMTYLLIGRLPGGFRMPPRMIHINQLTEIGELAKAYSSANVLINASAEESFGKVTAEAMSSGIPVIGLNATATPELISTETGYLLDSMDDEEVGKRIREIANKGRDFYETKCRERALQEFNKVKIINAYSILYKNIANIDQ